MRRAALVAVLCLLIAGTGLVAQTLTEPAHATEVLLSGDFEDATGTPPVAAGWTGSDDFVATPVCTPAYCTAASSHTGVGPHTGTNWAWFGGTVNDSQEAGLAQQVTLPQGSATLDYFVANPQSNLTGPDLATLEVNIDGKPLQRWVEGATPTTYTEETLDISEFADGGTHTLSFIYVHGSAGDNDFILDDVSIDAVAGPPVIPANAASLGVIPSPTNCAAFSYGAPRDVTFTVSGKIGTPTDIGVRFTFSPPHTFAGDVLVKLIAPNGRRADIFGGLADGSLDRQLAGPYLFDDHVPVTAPTFEEVADGTPFLTVPPGHFRAMIPGDTLTQAFADLGDANGTWTLRFLDACYADTGTVASADLYLTTDGVPVDTDGDGLPDVADDCPAKRGIAPTGCPDTTAPDTAFSTSPVDGVAKSLSVPFAFVATEAAVIYRCSFDGEAPAPCTNPTTLTVRPGRHTFSVAARDASGNIDPYPATSTFTAYDCPTLTAKVAKLRKKLSATKKAIKTTTAALAAAVKSGDHAKAKALEDRLQKLERTLKSTTKKLAKAKLATAPCGARAPARS